MAELPEEFLARMRAVLGASFDKFLQSYSRPPERAVRVNTLKISVEEFKNISPFPLENVPWEESGFYTPCEGLGKTPFHSAGLYYVQEPSAMSVAPKLEAGAGERVLDLCSAPGGKGTRLAEGMRGEGIIFLNEINFSRAGILSSNVERMGIGNAVVTCAPPEKLAEELGEYFDKILVDAPCSGEGMFKKEKNAIPEWSEANVAMCAVRQREILDSAYKMLAGGGRLVYSTCTFAPEEDELCVGDFIKKYPDCRLLSCEKLYPHEVRGEGHFVAVIEKSGSVRRDLRFVKPAFGDRKLNAEYRKWESENLKVTFENLHAVGDTLYSLPEGMPAVSARILRAGVRLGVFIKGRFEPDHSLAMYLNKEQAEGIELDENGALNYLKGLTFEAEGRGWKLALYKGFPLGWCKVSCGTAKNKLPKGLRINV